MIMFAASCAGSHNHSLNSTTAHQVVGNRPSHCDVTGMTNQIRAFLRAWNRESSTKMTSVVTRDVELDMSTRQQRSTPPRVGGGYTTRRGSPAVLKFAERQWTLGERFRYHRLSVSVSGHGGYALGFLAVFADGTRQRMSEAKFGFACPQARISHVVIVSSEVANA